MDVYKLLDKRQLGLTLRFKPNGNVIIYIVEERYSRFGSIEL